MKIFKEINILLQMHDLKVTTMCLAELVEIRPDYLIKKLNGWARLKDTERARIHLILDQIENGNIKII